MHIRRKRREVVFYDSARYSGRRQPYVGVTGATSSGDILSLSRVVPLTANRKLKIGVLASSKTLAGYTDVNPNYYPINRIGRLILSYKTLNLVHYSTDTPESLGTELLRIAYLLAHNSSFHGFQLDTPWPMVEELRKLYRYFRPQRLVLRVNLRDADLIEIVDRIELYLGYITDILLDASLDVEIEISEFELKYLEALSALRDSYPAIGLGFSVGLGRTNFAVVERFCREISYLSIDVQSKLRTSNDTLDVQEAKIYVEQAFTILKT